MTTNTREDEYVQVALDACIKLNEALGLISDALRAARAPIDNDEFDYVTIRGELIDMQEYLHDARQFNNKLHGSVIDLVRLIKRMHTSYNVIHNAWEIAQQEADRAMLRCLNDEMDQQETELLHEVIAALRAVQGFDKLLVVMRVHDAIQPEE
jgi:isochorismate hydrolase